VLRHLFLPTLSLIFLSACGQKSITDKIVIVNIHNYDREEIAKQIQNVNSLNPKVIALDIQFSILKDKKIDSLLKATLLTCDNLVMGSRLRNYTYEDIDYQDTLGCDAYFLTNAKTGFINAILEEDKFGTLKRFSIKEKMNGKTEYHFSIRTAMAFDSIRTMNFIENCLVLIWVYTN
jgi:CHASE2 domain-containing sensor protein